MKKICTAIIIVTIILFSACYFSGVRATDITELTGITGYVGNEDISWGTGQATDTFSVATSTGGTVTLTKVPGLTAAQESILKGVWYPSTDAAITDHGASDVVGSLAWVMAEIGSTTKTEIILPSATYTIDQNATVTSNITLRFLAGASLSIGAGDSVTFSSPRQIKSDSEDPIFLGSGVVHFTNPGEVRVDWWGQTSALIQKAFNAAVVAINPAAVAAWTERPNTPTVVKFTPGRMYTISSEIDCEIGRNIKVDMAGTYFTGTYDGTWFNLQDTNQYSVANSWSVGPSENIVVSGPAIMVNSGTNSASLAFKLYGCTDCSISQIKMDGFYKGIELGKSENVKIHDNIIANSTYGIHHPEFPTETGGDSGIDDNSSESTPWYSQNIRIFHNQINPKTAGGVNAIRIDRQVKGLRIWENGGGRIWDQYIYLGTSSYLNADFEGIEIRGNHYENIKGPVIHFADNNSKVPFRGVSIENNNITVFHPDDNSSFEIYHIERADGVRFNGNKYNFWRNPGGYTLYSLDENSTKITVGDAEAYWNIAPTITTVTYFDYDCDRDQITWEPQLRSVYKALTNYSPKTLPTGGYTLNLATELGDDYPDLIPKAVFVRVSAEDTLSDNSTSCMVSLRKNASNAVSTIVNVQLLGFQNSKNNEAEGWIPVKSDGTIYLDVSATDDEGTTDGNTTTVNIAVKEMKM